MKTSVRTRCKTSRWLILLVGLLLWGVGVMLVSRKVSLSKADFDDDGQIVRSGVSKAVNMMPSLGSSVGLYMSKRAMPNAS